jgi:membrane-bound metal-dependent hydrolase YbcI (DUF457 family)
MPFPIAHALVGASVGAAIYPDQSRRTRTLLVGGLLGICPDFDYALNWLRVSGGGWHHGFTHSIPFAFFLGLLIVVIAKQWKLRSFIFFTAAIASHTLLDYLLTESRGVALWWPLTNYRYRLRLPNPIDYSWSNPTVWDIAFDVLRIGLLELVIFGPLLLAVILLRSANNATLPTE